MNPTFIHTHATRALHSSSSRTSVPVVRPRLHRGWRSLFFHRPSALRALLATTGVLAAASHLQADVVLDWDQIMEETVRASDPMTQVRAAAITQLAVFEAVNSIVGDYEPYVEKLPAPPGALAEAAAIAAAHRALVLLYPAPAQVTVLDNLRAASLAAIPDSPARAHGIAVGLAAAEMMVALRANDGHGATMAFTPRSGPGEWQPTPPAHAAAVGRAWGEITPFGVEKVTRFRPPPPPHLRSGRYAHAWYEVKRLGAADSRARPADRAQVAQFYAVALGVECYHQGARQVSRAQGRTLSENARALALVSMAVCDALIGSMNAKYHYRFWRPVTAIRAAETDHNPVTRADPDFLPLVTTPPFPSYPSNHATMAGAARFLLDRLYGPRGHTITLTSPKQPGVAMRYSAWWQIAEDIDDARIYGGIHFRFDQEAGTRTGRRIAEDILRHELRPYANRVPIMARSASGIRSRAPCERAEPGVCSRRTTDAHK